MLTLDIAGDQTDGARDYQEDAFLTTHLGDPHAGGSLVIVADGMGGHAAGNVASNMAVQTFNKHLTSNFPSDSMPAVLREAAHQANRSITETVRETAALKGMGCTLVGVVVENKLLHWVSVGDSHLYLIRDHQIKKKNADHSYGGFLNRMAAEGSPIEPEAGFSRNMLMSALTGEDIADIDCPETPLELRAGDRIIVASDGLDTLSAGKIVAFSEASPSAKQCVEALLTGVEKAKIPRQDNTTVVVIDILGKPVAEPAVATDSTAAAITISRDPEPPPTPTAVGDGEKKKTGVALTISVLALMIFIGAGVAYWHFIKGEATKTIEPPVTDYAAVDEQPSEPEEDAPNEVVAPTEQEPAVQAEVETAAPAGTGETFRDPLKSGGQGPLMIWVPAGSFNMGARGGTDFDELPQHKVTLSRFAMSVHEVTIAEYGRFVKGKGRKPPKTGELDADTYPVFYTSWDDALDYTKWLSEQTGKTYHLPSESQWEYAARAGSSSAYWWGRDLGDDHAHCFACNSGLDPRKPTKVGRFKANPFGIYDTAGNLQEWVYDCYNPNYQGAPDDGGVFEGGDCGHRVVRGGSYTSGPKSLRSSDRDKFPSDRGNDQIGIRIVRDP